MESVGEEQAFDASKGTEMKALDYKQINYRLKSELSGQATSKIKYENNKTN